MKIAVASIDGVSISRHFGRSRCFIVFDVENGEIVAPVKNATLIGHGPTALEKISMLDNDFGMDDGVGTCGKGGQTVPVGVGQPTVKVDALTVGGAG